MLRSLFEKGRLSRWSYRWFQFFSQEEEHYRFNISGPRTPSVCWRWCVLGGNLLAGDRSCLPGCLASLGAILALGLVLH
jgi:hypothetical protein